MFTNIVQAVFCGSRAAVTKPLTQGDYGQAIEFIGIELPAAFTVYFSNERTVGTAKAQTGRDGIVEIPNEYLQTGLPVYGWVFLHAGENDGRTEYTVTTPVTASPEHTDEEPTPVQESRIETAIAALNAGVEEVEQIAENLGDFETAMAAVEAAKTDAEQSASEAAGSATAAATSENNAAGSATAAETAKGKAEDAQAAAETAQGKAEDAQAAAEAVRDSIPEDYSELSADVSELKTELDDIVVTTTSPNLYNPTVCNPADLHTYNSSGAYTESNNFATSGKIPVEAETQYTFSANGTAKNVRYFKGDSGETFISGENTTGTFTTPVLCTFVAVQLFAAAHHRAVQCRNSRRSVRTW